MKHSLPFSSDQLVGISQYSFQQNSMNFKEFVLIRTSNLLIAEWTECFFFITCVFFSTYFASDKGGNQQSTNNIIFIDSFWSKDNDVIVQKGLFAWEVKNAQNWHAISLIGASLSPVCNFSSAKIKMKIITSNFLAGESWAR